MGALNIVLASSSKVAVPICDYLIANHGMKAVITGPDKPTGRGRNLTPNEFSVYCTSRGLEVFKPADDLELERLLESVKPDLVVTAAYGRLIKKHQLSMPQKGWINVHFSELPKWRGAAPVQFSILNGDKTSGITVFRLETGLDTGPVYASKVHPLKGDETAGDLLETLSELSIQPLQESLHKIEMGIEPVAQGAEQVSLAPKISKEDGFIDWSNSAVSTERKIRAFSPWPGAWSRLGERQISITEAEISKTEIDSALPVGTVITTPQVIVICGVGALQLKRVKPEGKREMSADEWVRGIQDKEHLRFELS